MQTHANQSTDSAGFLRRCRIGCAFVLALAAFAMLFVGLGLARFLPLPGEAVAESAEPERRQPPESLVSPERARLLQSSVDSVALGLGKALAAMEEPEARRELLSRALSALTFELGGGVYFTAWEGTRMLHSPLSPDTAYLDFAQALDRRGVSFVREMERTAARGGGFITVTLPRQLPYRLPSNPVSNAAGGGIQAAPQPGAGAYPPFAHAVRGPVIPGSPSPWTGAPVLRMAIAPAPGAADKADNGPPMEPEAKKAPRSVIPAQGTWRADHKSRHQALLFIYSANQPLSLSNKESVAKKRGRQMPPPTPSCPAALPGPMPSGQETVAAMAGGEKTPDAEPGTRDIFGERHGRTLNPNSVHDSRPGQAMFCPLRTQDSTLPVRKFAASAGMTGAEMTGAEDLTAGTELFAPLPEAGLCAIAPLQGKGGGPTGNEAGNEAGSGAGNPTGGKAGRASVFQNSAAHLAAKQSFSPDGQQILNRAAPVAATDGLAGKRKERAPAPLPPARAEKNAADKGRANASLPGNGQMPAGGETAGGADAPNAGLRGKRPRIFSTRARNHVEENDPGYTLVMDKRPVEQVIYVRRLPDSDCHIAAFMQGHDAAMELALMSCAPEPGFSPVWMEPAFNPDQSARDMFDRGLCVSGFSLAGLAGLLMVPSRRRGHAS
ncbi:hypothetical protein LJC59_10400, partial [Desulfovibrio sp. OttesenSCG-928-A18]|nr:hypothetical protein [Desulfovibrio sp. OttesenSCG-928-A18]